MPTDRTKRSLGFGRSTSAQIEGGKIVGSGLRTLFGGGKSGSSTGAKRVRAPSSSAGGGMRRAIRGMFGMSK